MEKSFSSARFLNMIGVPLVGLIAGGCVAVNILGMSVRLPANFWGGVVAGAAVGALLLLLLRLGVRRLVARSRLSPVIRDGYRDCDAVAYLPFLLLLGLGAGLQVSVPVVYGVLLAFAAAQGLLLLALARRVSRGPEVPPSLGWLVFLFLVSGMAALVYQIVWQRVLFSAYGVNIESITIIVSLFMFGLGMGSLLGGALSRRYPEKLVQMFVACECGIGLFGLISLPLIGYTAARTLDLSLPGITLAVYALLCLPTLLMGATLPLLVTHLHRRSPNIGRCVGLLYFFNTIGSALACFLTVDLLFVFAGRQAAVGVAALLNFLVAAGVVLYARQARRAAPASGAEAGEAADAVASANRASLSIPYSLVLLISALAGYLSLSQEMLWVRTVSYSAQGMPQVFGQVLGFFLVGIALGSLSGKRFCERADQGKAGHPLAFIGRLFLFGSLAYFLCIPLFAEVALFDKTLSLVLSYLTVGLVAFVYGTILPVISHFGIAPGKPVGTSLSRIYMANIVGSTLGPILTGFYLMDRFTLEANVLGVSLGSLAFAAALFAIAPLRARARWGFAGLVAACALGAVALQGALYGNLLGKLQHGPKFAEHAPFDQIVQNRSGIITTQPDSLGDLIYGGGAYDGRFTVDAARNSNGIRRGYMMAALHRDPADVLEIGLSSGSWAWVIAAYEPVKSLTVVEINPGYPAVIGKYGEGHADFLYDSTVTIHYDDGRRWLNRNPDARFDFILMNTTFHWRSNITNLVSREFLELAKRHLKPGGVMYYNATGSPDVVRTAAEVFRHVTMVASFVAASDGPFDMSEAEKRARFDLFLAGPDRRPVFADSAQRAAAAEMAATPLPDLAPAYRARANLRVITDDNMLTEFKSISRKGIMGRLYRWRDPNLAWARIAARRDSADVAAAAR